MEKGNENNITYAFMWEFTPETEPGEEENEYKEFLKKLYLQNLYPKLAAKKDKDLLKRNYK